MKHLLLLASSALILFSNADARVLAVSDLQSMRHVSDPQVSPDGRWVAYELEQMDTVADEMRTQLWKVSWDGKQRLALTHTSSSATRPRWSPDGTTLAFLSQRGSTTKKPDEGDEPTTQVWLLNSLGGEAQPLTDVRGEISDFAWSPDGRRLALVMREADDASRRADAKPTPLVIDRYRFKDDSEGYWHEGTKLSRVYLYDIASKSLSALTNDGRFQENDPVWSPDGSRIAFVSNRDDQWDRTINEDIWVIEARPGATPQRLSKSPGADTTPVWRPDCTEILYVEGPEPKFAYYGPNRLAVVASNGGEPRYPAASLDRDVSGASFSLDGKFIDFIVDDDRQVYLASVRTNGGPITRKLDGPRVVRSPSNRSGHTAVIVSDATTPAEVYAWEKNRLRALTSHNQEWLTGVDLARTQALEFSAADGTKISALLTTPRDHVPGRRSPLLLWIHGGPYGQDDYAFDFERQLFAAQGYSILQVNYRGSSGRGAAFGHGIFADWGNKDLTDLLDGVNHVIALGIADPTRMMVGGWSNGGIMTNYVIARDPRFKAAVSGAGYGNLISFYGFDQYTSVYDTELQAPWVDPELWMRLSYPLFEANKIRTPTLYVCGQLDFNVPLIGSEQMYQALKSLNVPTQLIIYPDEHHGISRPSFQLDRLQRYLAWYAKHL